MTPISRRSLLGTAGAGLGALVAGSLDGCAASLKGDLAPKSSRRVVVVGGGWGGAMAAKYVRLGDPTIEVKEPPARPATPTPSVRCLPVCGRN